MSVGKARSQSWSNVCRLGQEPIWDSQLTFIELDGKSYNIKQYRFIMYGKLTDYVVI
jgi:hypothetical protein